MGPCPSCGSLDANDALLCQSCGSRISLAGNVSTPRSEDPAAADTQSRVPENPAKALDTNVAAALTYLGGFITGIVFLSLDPYKSNSFVRFHAFQSIFLNLAWVALWIVWMILSVILTSLTAGAFGVIAVPLMFAFAAVGFGIWVFLMYQAYQQNLFRLPMVGKLAAERAGVRL
jgi:uncharacterized membrane protein